MSENTHGTVNLKQTQMAAVQAALDMTPLATAKVWNPWRHVVDSSLDVADLEAPAKRGEVPDIIADGKTFADLKAVQLGNLGAAAGLDGPVTGATFERARVELRKRYVAAGRAKYQTATSANCTLFACCVIGMFADRPDLLGPGVTVELVNILATVGGQGHAYVLVGRAPGDLHKIGTYGPSCFFVDQWYARQQAVKPGTNGVKDATSIHGDGTSPFWDLDFVGFITDDTKLAVRLTFTSDELAELGR
ncbi:hypothetical protein [Streptosporangium carneum]|uniref:Uncharacterized protein n=1 Tax=Streptosporangium carneum TaxID=47481 RepID=A0A9W6HWC7_9ACTN|nr:hypothetical protein [Streptosporangium carneum]GLK06884.1 hypothetical protein GCM10017600_02890 [Streptosporangium carneum]